MSAREQKGFYDEIDSIDRIEIALVGIHSTRFGEVKVIAPDLTFKEKMMNFFVQQGFKRNDYKVSPGLYVLGEPNADSDVFVTANYKLSVDVFRQNYKGNCWLLVLDTHGINVWCAAGKGTFGTNELIRMISKSRLSRLVNHKRIIVPQLGAPGVSGYLVSKKTGFKVIFGPVRAQDLGQFIKGGYLSEAKMRKVTFTLKERLILTPLECMQSLRYGLASFVLFAVLVVLTSNLTPFEGDIVRLLWVFIGTVIVGSFLFPVVLPYLKGRAFTKKALPLTLVWFISIQIFMQATPYELLANIGTGLSAASLVEFFALNFTGATPITSYSETKEETLKVIPWIIGVYIVGIIAFTLSIWQVI